MQEHIILRFSLQPAVIHAYFGYQDISLREKAGEPDIKILPGEIYFKSLCKN